MYTKSIGFVKDIDRTEQVDALIKELRAIKNNAAYGAALPFWG